MIHDEPLFILPLVNHLVQQGMKRFGPAVTADVATTQDNFGLAAVGGGTVVAKPALHATRDADWNLAERTAKSLPIVLRVPASELSNEW